MEKNHQNIQHKLDETKNRFISTLAQNMDLYGITKTNGRLYGTVFFAEQPMTLDDMGEALGMSKMSMSTGIRTLMETNLVEQVWRKGVRKDLYQSNQDWYQSFTSVFVNRCREAANNNQKAALLAKKTLESCLEDKNASELRDTIQQDLEKIDYALNYYEWLHRVIYLFESDDIFKKVPPSF